MAALHIYLLIGGASGSSAQKATSTGPKTMSCMVLRRSAHVGRIVRCFNVCVQVKSGVKIDRYIMSCEFYMLILYHVN